MQNAKAMTPTRSAKGLRSTDVAAPRDLVPVSYGVGIPAQGHRYSDRPVTATSRIGGVVATGAVCLSILVVLLFRWGGAPATIVPVDLSVIDISEPAAPPAPSSEIPPGPEQVQREPDRAADTSVLPVPLIALPALAAQTSPVEPSVADPGPPVERTTAPEARDAPAASTPSDARSSWEGRVLAALNKVKRYPREASRNRQQGTPWLRFIMDRAGKVRSVRLERSSGFDALDREALALPNRAEPLPVPSDNVPGDRIELVVPVEFFMR